MRLCGHPDARGLRAGSYFLTVGSRDPRKNLARLVEAYGQLDAEDRRRFPLVVVGMNSIAAYCLSGSFVKPELHKMVRKHLGEKSFDLFGHEYAPLVHGALTLTLLWLILLWMYRRKVFLRV